jgi:hypothetical protein
MNGYINIGKKSRVYINKNIIDNELNWFEAYDLEIDREMVKFTYIDYSRNEKRCTLITHISNVIIEYDNE